MPASPPGYSNCAAVWRPHRELANKVGISTKEISEVIKERLKDFDASLVSADVGRIVATSDGIAQVYGLQNAMSGELLEFPGDTYGLALNLEQDQVRAVIL